MREVMMKSKIVVLILAIAAFSAPMVMAAQDLQIKPEGSGEATGIQDKTGLPGSDWSAVTVELEPGTVRSWLSRPDGELLYVLEGSGRLEVSGRSTITLNPGMVARLDSAPRHVVKNTSGGKNLKVLIVFRTEHGEVHPLLAARKVRPSPDGSTASKEDPRLLRTEKPNQGRPLKAPEDIGLVF